LANRTNRQIENQELLSFLSGVDGQKVHNLCTFSQSIFSHNYLSLCTVVIKNYHSDSRSCCSDDLVG